jgi:hypothetical protein
MSLKPTLATQTVLIVVYCKHFDQQKGRSMVAFMYDYYLDDYDYFLTVIDDSLIIMERRRFSGN